MKKIRVLFALPKGNIYNFSKTIQKISFFILTPGNFYGTSIRKAPVSRGSLLKSFKREGQDFLPRELV